LLIQGKITAAFRNCLRLSHPFVHAIWASSSARSTEIPLDIMKRAVRPNPFL
jgi:hypothetical protein